jgi:hypothetical protein
MNDDMFIITIAIQMHGKVIAYELDYETSKIFENTRLLCKAGGFIDYYSNVTEEVFLKNSLYNIFRNNIYDTHTYNLIKQAKQGIIVGNITFDKSLSTTISEPGIMDYLSPLTYIQGIYLISIHQGGKLIYPSNKSETIQLLNVNNLIKLAEFFKTEMPNLKDLSSPFPKQPPENIVRDNESVRNNFYNELNKWKLTLNKDGTKIDPIKLSTMVKLLKTIIGKQCLMNILDYSCNSSSIYIPKKQHSSAQYMMPYDLEQGISTTWGGRKTKKLKKSNLKNPNSKKNLIKKPKFNKKKYTKKYYFIKST